LFLLTSNQEQTNGQAMAEAIETIMQRLDNEIRQCEKCPLCETRTQAVPGHGNVRAKIMFLGEAPGRQEDEQGIPFIGRAGKLLTGMLEANGLNREEIYITNAVKCRPPENRNPTNEEMTTCRANWLDRQIELIDPELIVLLGKVPLFQMLNEKGALKNFHGEIREQDGRRFFMTYHPAAALRSPVMRAMMEEDFQKLGSMEISHE
jgi:DNA polymerase